MFISSVFYKPSLEGLATPKPHQWLDGGLRLQNIPCSFLTSSFSSLSFLVCGFLVMSGYLSVFLPAVHVRREDMNLFKELKKKKFFTFFLCSENKLSVHQVSVVWQFSFDFKVEPVQLSVKEKTDTFCICMYTPLLSPQGVTAPDNRVRVTGVWRALDECVPLWVSFLVADTEVCEWAATILGGVVISGFREQVVCIQWRSLLGLSFQIRGGS